MLIFPEVDLTAENVNELRRHAFVIPGGGKAEKHLDDAQQLVEQLSKMVRCTITQPGRDIVNRYAGGFLTGCYFGMHVQKVLGRQGCADDGKETVPGLEFCRTLLEEDPDRLVPRMYAHKLQVEASFPNYNTILEAQFPSPKQRSSKTQADIGSYARYGACVVIDIPVQSSTVA